MQVKAVSQTLEMSRVVKILIYESNCYVTTVIVVFVSLKTEVSKLISALPSFL